MTAAKVKDHPILFSGPMVLALLEGRKTRTRRLSKRWLKVKAGDFLWVRETLTRSGGMVQYVADFSPTTRIWPSDWKQDPRPSIHMPREFSRIALEATEDARLERLQDITKEEALAEGISVLPLQDVSDPSAWYQSAPGVHQERTAVASFGCLWNSLHTKPERWCDNPELVRLAFRRLL